MNARATTRLNIAQFYTGSLSVQGLRHWLLRPYAMKIPKTSVPGPPAFILDLFPWSRGN